VSSIDGRQGASRALRVLIPMTFTVTFMTGRVILSRPFVGPRCIISK
jgi:hypothetical protein